MPKRVRNITKDNAQLIESIRKLDHHEKAIWKKVAYELAKPRRQRIEVNLSKIDTYAKEGDFILVPGKVLGSGGMNKKITVAAFSFSESAKKLITDAGAKAISLEELMQQRPDGRGILILK